MCGISVLIDQQNNPVSSTLIRSSTDVIKHRGPDAEGIYFGDNFAFGHRRLSILDLSKEGNQPMEYNGLVITYNGEIYNYIELKKELGEHGYKFKTKTDTEVILASYHFWGEECVKQFNGMWAFVIYDESQKILFGSRDRFGVKPFYYTLNNNFFSIGSEIKQFTILPDWKSNLNQEVIQVFFKNSSQDFSTGTFFKDVFQLRGGNNMIYNLSNHSFEIKKFYNPKFKTSQTSSREAINKYQNIFKDAIRLRLRSDVKVGTALSGGVDSSSIVGVMHNLLNDDLESSELQETVSACFTNKKYSEENYIDEVVDKFEIKSNKVFCSIDDLEESLQQLIWHQDEPFPSMSMLAQFMVFKKANKRGLTVMIDGQGADEVIGSYYGFYKQLLKEQFKRKDFGKLLSNCLGIPFFQRKETLRALYSKYKTKSIPDFKFLRIDKKIPYKKNDSSFKVDDVFLQKCLNATFDNSLPALLHYEDRNSMAFSIESRVPFLDYRLVEFTLNLPLHYKINSGKRKYIIREACKNYLPTKIYNRHDKMGFVTPQEVWMKSHSNFFKPLYDQIDEITNGFIDTHKLSYEDFLNTFGDKLLWKVIIFSQWVKRFNVTI